MASNANTAIWDRLAKTDPAHTKAFNRAGGFKGTSVKPIWTQRRLTEEFGPCGIGWGVNKPEHEYVPAGDGEVLVFCTVSAWHGNKGNILWGVGGDKAVTRRSDGKLFVDDEAAKKAFTDAVGNAFKSIGVAGDIHMGLFDDDKHVTAMKAEFAEPEPKPDVVTAEQRAILIGLMEAAGVPVRDVLNAAKIDDLSQLPAASFESVRKKLNLTIDKNTQAQDAQPRKAA